MAIQKVSSTDFNKGVITTGAGNYELPRDMVDPLYSPGWPVAPVTRPEDNELPRTLDYPVGINYTLQPRVGYEGLMPVKALKAAYTNVAEVSSPVNLIIREMSGFMAMLRDKKTKQKAKLGHPYQWMTTSPDRTVPFNVWLTRYKKSAKIYAAPAFYMKRDQGAITAMEYIDGSTLFLIINSRGNLPSPDEVDEDVIKFMQRIQYGLSNNDQRVLTSMPEIAQQFLKKQRDRLEAGKQLVTTTPAYTQIIKGVPFSFWDKDQVYFIPEPPSSTVDSPYGETYIERSWTWINMIAVMTAFELAHYKTGNTPEGLMMMPKDMFPSMAKLATGEREWNARMADTSQVQHARNRWMPEGTQYIPTKAPDFPEVLYKKAKENILAALGVPASEMGEKPGAGLGGAGFEKGTAHDVTRQILEVEKESLEDAFNYVLQKDGVDDVEFYMDYPQEEIDPSQQQEDLWNKFSHGVFTLNDVLTTQGKSPIGNPQDPENVANMHLIVAGTTMFVIEKIKPNEDGIISPQGSQSLPGAGGSPFGPEDGIVPPDKKGLKPDKKAIKQFAQQVEEKQGKGFGKVTYSIPLEKKLAQDDAVCPEDVDPKQFEEGMKEEHEEHPSLDGSQVAQVVVDHLREDPDYYGKLMKNCGVDPQDAQYFGAPIIRDQTLELSRTSNNQVEVIAMVPDGLDQQTALWKPAGGEKPQLSIDLGGPQYVREEAAWLLDQSLGFQLVPLAYVTESPEGEKGAAVWYTTTDEAPKPVTEYSPSWIEKAAVIDYIMNQLDRKGKNYLTHPQDPTRPILYDNGMAFPEDEHPNRSSFVSAWENKPLTEGVMESIRMALGDTSMWSDVEDLIGPVATAKAQACAQELLSSGVIQGDKE